VLAGAAQRGCGLANGGAVRKSNGPTRALRYMMSYDRIVWVAGIRCGQCGRWLLPKATARPAARDHSAVAARSRNRRTRKKPHYGRGDGAALDDRSRRAIACC
jgi:hypothetical protein